VRVTGGRGERAEQHAARLRRDAARLGLPPPGQIEIESLLIESARSAFGSGDGILRVEWSRLDDDLPELRAIPRPLGPEPNHWLATVSRATHPGPEQRHNTKHVNVPVYEFARAEADESKVDEMLIFGADGLLVEGGRSNFILVTNSGRLVTPDLALGAVEGLGLTLVLENRPEIEFAELTEKDVASARELMSVNAVRGVIPIVELAGRPIADGRPGPWARRLRYLFRSEPRNP
jgi:branched-subunit amino acid aminotransferase/4-amino-4-deoxychorismate lyase